MASIAAELRYDGNLDIGESLACASMSLARRLVGGATLWCVAPEWPDHARHVAVEFVHPVIVGKRAFPAISVESADPVGSLRPLVRGGDVVLMLGRRDLPLARELANRATAWGVTTIWIGAGPRPTSSVADHLLWADDDDGLAARDGRMVLLYHLLWELTQVCVEHGGLRPAEADGDCADGQGCITCTDEGRLGEVVGMEGPDVAHVRTPQGIEVVDVTIVGPLLPGDLVLIHAGIAVTVVS